MLLPTIVKLCTSSLALERPIARSDMRSGRKSRDFRGLEIKTPDPLSLIGDQIEGINASPHPSSKACGLAN